MLSLSLGFFLCAPALGVRLKGEPLISNAGWLAVTSLAFFAVCCGCALCFDHVFGPQLAVFDLLFVIGGGFTGCFDLRTGFLAGASGFR